MSKSLLIFKNLMSHCSVFLFKDLQLHKHRDRSSRSTYSINLKHQVHRASLLLAPLFEFSQCFCLSAQGRNAVENTTSPSVIMCLALQTEF